MSSNSHQSRGRVGRVRSHRRNRLRAAHVFGRASVMRTGHCGGKGCRNRLRAAHVFGQRLLAESYVASSGNVAIAFERRMSSDFFVEVLMVLGVWLGRNRLRAAHVFGLWMRSQRL